MYTDDQIKNLSAEDKSRQRHSTQMQMTIADSDTKKLIAEKSLLDGEIRKLKMDSERIRINLEERQKRLERVNFQISQGDQEQKRMKKKMNLL